MLETLTPNQCGALATIFLARNEQILARWRARVEADPHVENSPRLSRSQFHDHIPEILQAFGERLRQQPKCDEQRQRESEMAHQHSRHRWQQGYSLKSLLHEWGELNFVVLESLDNLVSHPTDEINAAMLRKARLEWAEMMTANLSEGVAAYNELLQTEASARLRHLERAVEKASEFERERGELLRQTSHDLRGNLSMVAHASELLQAEKISLDERSQVTEILRGGVRTLSEMLHDLLAMSRLEAGQESLEVVPFDAAALLRGLAESSQALAIQKGLWLRIDGPDELPVMGDASKVGRIAQNLLLNALSYTKEGGVTLTWQRRDERQWSFEILDTGPGVSTSPLASRLVQATREARDVEDDARPNPVAPLPASGELAVGGEGIGLAIVRRLCELLDATLELDSNNEQGTRFRVVLPVRYASG